MILCTATNEAYAPGAAVALASALRRLPRDTRATVAVLDGGLRPRSWKRLAATVAAASPSADLRRLSPAMGDFAGLPRDWGSSVMTYARLALPALLDAPRVVYLDADLIVQADVSPLFDRDLRGSTVAAALDVITRTLGAERLPLAELGLPADDPYFQAGFLVIDLERWRSTGVSDRVLAYLRDWPRHARHWDQSALNVVLHHAWDRLPDDWNTPAWWAVDGRDGCRLDAPVLHFVGPHKPWLRGHHSGAAAARFYAELDHTGWRGWRPTALRAALKLLKYRASRLLRR